MESKFSENQLLKTQESEAQVSDSLRNFSRTDFAHSALFNKNSSLSVLPGIELVDHKEPDKSKQKSKFEVQHFTIPLGANSDYKKKSVPMEEISKPENRLPDAWEQPAASFMDGKCGITGVANMLRMYGVEKDPKELDSYDFRSWGPGMRSDKFKENLNLLSQKNFSACSLSATADGLATLRKHLDEGKPVAIQFMTGPTNAHWVVVSGIKDEKNGTELQVMSWGAYYKIKWDDLAEPWKRGYGGPYPHVVCDSASNLLKRSAK